MSVEELNRWVGDHQLLVSLIATPLLSILVGGVAAWYSARKTMASERTQRVHQSALEIARYRQAWIDSLRDDLGEFSGLAAIAYTGQPPADRVERISILSMRIRMRMNSSDEDYAVLVAALERDTKTYFLGRNEKSRIGAPLVQISPGILKREWERLKSDLREAER